LRTQNIQVKYLNISVTMGLINFSDDLWHFSFKFPKFKLNKVKGFEN